MIEHHSRSTSPVTFDDIVAAAGRLSPYLTPTPVLRLDRLDADLGAHTFVKAESFQPTGAYKARGALHAVLCLTEQERRRGVLAHSSGNHGMALAWAARQADVECTVVVPENTDPLKLRELDRYGATVVLCPPGGREASAAVELERTGATFVHPYEHPDVIAGHGTAALEFLTDVPDLDVIIAPIGGGSLLASTTIVAAELQPAARCLGAEPLAVDDAYRSLVTGVRQPAVADPNTVAQAVLGGIGERSFEVLTRLGAKVITVTESEIISASRFCIEVLKLVVEPSAATVLALARSLDVAHQRVGLIVSGGNTNLSWYR